MATDDESLDPSESVPDSPIGGDAIWGPPGDPLELPELSDADYAVMQEHFASQYLSGGGDPDALESLNRFARAIQDRSATAAVALLASTAPGAAANTGSYESELASVLSSAPDRDWHGEIFPGSDLIGDGDLIWAHVVGSTPGRGPWHDRATIQVALRREGDEWKVDADLLDATYRPKMDTSVVVDPLRLFNLPATGEVGFRPFALDGWEGPIGLAGADISGDYSSPQVVLLHGDCLTIDGPRVLVESSPGTIDSSTGYHQLAQAERPVEPSMSHRESRAVHAEQESIAASLAAQPKFEIALPVDGVDHSFRGTRTAHGFAVTSRVDNVSIGVTAIEVPESSIALKSIDDVRAYADGMAAQWAAAAEASKADETSESNVMIQVSRSMDAPAAEDDMLDFSLDVFGRLSKMTPSEIAAITAESVHDAHGGAEEYASTVAKLLDRRPIVLSTWDNQPRMTGSETARASIQMLFEGENPFLRWTPIDLVIEDGEVRLDLDMVALASRSG